MHQINGRLLYMCPLMYMYLLQLCTLTCCSSLFLVIPMVSCLVLFVSFGMSNSILRGNGFLPAYVRFVFLLELLCLKIFHGNA